MKLRIKDFTTKVGSGVTPRGGAEVYKSEGIPLFRSQNVTNEGLLLEDIAYIDEEVHQSMSGTHLKAGDVLLNITGASIGRCYYLPKNFKEGNVNQHVCIIRPKNNVIPQFLYYNLISDDGQRKIDLSQTGANREGLTKEDICNFRFVIPSLDEQSRIVSYLDSKTAAIDKQVSLLSEKRDAYLRLKKSIINRAVTKGLNPNVKMKDSGVDWIGKIPEGWSTRRIKDVCSNVFMGKTPVYTLHDNEYFIIGQKNNQTYGIDFDGIKFAEEDFYLQRNEYEFLQYGDVLLNTLGGGSVGRVGYFDYNGSNKILTDGHLMVLRSNTYSTKYLYYYLSTKRNELENMAIGSTNQSFFNISDIIILSVPFPSLSEQQAITSYLDDKCSKIDSIVKNIDTQIEKYKLLKRALINEVVTGKRAV